jgi:hypothetical protein
MRMLCLYKQPPVRTDWELRVILYNTRKVTPKKIYKTEDTCCLADLCLPPNQVCPHRPSRIHHRSDNCFDCIGMQSS